MLYCDFHFILLVLVLYFVSFAMTDVLMYSRIIPFFVYPCCGLVLYCIILYCIVVSMIVRIAWDIRYFCTVLFLTIIGFSQAFWLLSNNDLTSTFGTVQGSFLNTFLYMLGGFDNDFGSTVNPGLAIAILVFFLFFMAILMLNLLIALMGQSFSEVQANGLGQWRLELASTLVDMGYLMSNDQLYPKQCSLYVMKYTSNLAMKDILESYGVQDDEKFITGNEELHDSHTNLGQFHNTGGGVAAASIDHNVVIGLSGVNERLNHIEHTLKEINNRSMHRDVRHSSEF